MANISTFSNTCPGIPSTINRYFEASPFPNCIFGMAMFLSLLLYTFNVYVLEPMLVKTVSKYTVSFENDKFPTLGSKSKSFLQENKIVNTMTII